MKTLLAILSLIFGSSMTGGTLTGGSINQPTTWQPPVVDLEERCIELGADCKCNETWNLASDVDLSANPTREYNPPNSTTKECKITSAPNYAIQMPSDYSKSRIIRASSTDSPFGNGADPTVYLGALHGISSARMTTQDQTNKTLCQRAYRKYSPGFTIGDIPTPGTYRVKNMTVSYLFGSGTKSNFAHQQDQTNIAAIWTNPNCTPTLDGQQNFAIQERCSDTEWCRMEICCDHNASAGTLQYRYYVDGVTSGTSYTATSPLGTNCPATWQADSNVTGVDMFVQDLGITDPETAPYNQYLSYSMQAVVDYDPTFRIGPACEIETPGGCP